MNPRYPPRMRAMTAGDVRVRAVTARKYLEVGDLVQGEPDDPAERQVAGGLAVLAAIAASDAICGSVLRECPQGQDHRQAEAVLATIRPGGKELARHLGYVLAEQSTAHYGTTYLNRDTVVSMLHHARALVDAIDSYR